MGMTIKSRTPVSWIAFVAVSAILAALLGNIASQYLFEAINNLMSADGTTAMPDFMPWYAAARAANPPLGISTESIYLAVSGFSAFFIVMNADERRRASLSGKVDPTTVHGTARLAEDNEIARYAHTSTKTRNKEGKRVEWACPEICEDVLDDNYILSKKAMISISKNPNQNYERNKHVFVMAGSGAGKTWNFVQSNVMNLGSSLVFTDPKGEILERNGVFLQNHGYKLKVVNVKDENSFAASNCYNPLHYCKNATAIAEIVDLIIKNTSGDSSSPKSGEDFFVKAETQLYGALASYLYFMYKDVAPQYCTIPEMIDLLAMTKQDQNAAKSQLDIIFFGTEAENFSGFREQLVRKYGSEERARMMPEWYAITQYEGFCTTKGSPETIASIIASCYVRLGPFAISSVRNMFSNDDLELEKFATEKTALFIVTSAQKGTYDFIAAMLLYQLFDVLTTVADKLPGKHLPMPVCCYLDEVANIGKIPGLAKQVAVLRSYWVNLIVIVQSETDLERAYGKEDTASIRNNCDTTLYLGRGNYETCEKISKEIGDTTRSYDSWSVSESSNGTSTSKSVQYVKVPLMSPSYIANEMPQNSCLVHFKEENWYLDQKANPMEHRRWKEWSQTPSFDIQTWAIEKEAERSNRITVEENGDITFVDNREMPAGAEMPTSDGFVMEGV